MSSNVPTAAMITPAPEVERCAADGCDAAELLARIEPDCVDESRVLCPNHRVTWLREVSGQ